MKTPLILIVLGALSVFGALWFVGNDGLNLMLMHPLVMAAWYLACWGGGLTASVGVGLAAFRLMKTRQRD